MLLLRSPSSHLTEPPPAECRALNGVSSPPPCSPGSPVVSGGLGVGRGCPEPTVRAEGCRLRTQNPLGLLRPFPGCSRPRR